MPPTTSTRHSSLDPLFQGILSKMSDIHIHLTGDSDADADALDEAVGTIEALMNERSGLRKRMVYRVAPRYKRDAARLGQIIEYKGPGLKTLSLLTEGYAQWMRAPYTFWGWRIDPVGDPQAYVVDSFMRVDTLIRADSEDC